MSDKDLYDKILKASELIHKSSTKGSANYIVTSSSVANMIQNAYADNRKDYRKIKIKRLFNE